MIYDKNESYIHKIVKMEKITIVLLLHLKLQKLQPQGVIRSW
jgi:hypothetical protein